MYIFKVLRETILISILLFVCSGNINASSNAAKDFNWSRVMDAITAVESEGDPKAVSGDCVGAMQIKPILVKDCNRILSEQGSKKQYKLSDRFDVKKSREMFVIIMNYYNPTNNIERAIRLWNGGVRYTVKGTQNYYQKVMKELRK